MGNLSFPNIVACFVLRCVIYLPLIVGSAIDTKETHPGEGETQHLQTSYHVSTPTAAFPTYDRTHSTHDTEKLTNTDYSLHRRSAREDFQTKTDSEPQFSIEEFHRIFRKYLTLLPKSKHYSVGDDEDSLDPGSNSPGRNNERDNNNNQSGTINVYIKGNVHIRGNVNIDTSGQGNGVRNAYGGQDKDTTTANHPIIVESETDFSDVVTIPRKTEGIVDQRQGSSQIVVPTKSSTRKLRSSQTPFQPSD